MSSSLAGMSGAIKRFFSKVGRGREGEVVEGELGDEVDVAISVLGRSSGG